MKALILSITIINLLVGYFICKPLIYPALETLEAVVNTCGRIPPEKRTEKQKELCKPSPMPFGGVIIPGLL